VGGGGGFFLGRGCLGGWGEMNWGFRGGGKAGGGGGGGGGGGEVVDRAERIGVRIV